MKINKKEVFELKLDFFNDDLKRFPYLDSQQEHYRLLVYLTNLYNEITIIDAGTNFGHSCLALAQNLNNKILTYDIVPKNLNFLNQYPNVSFKQMDINNESEEILKSTKIILLDIDPHDGIQETKFINHLINIGYRGYVICDDIYLNDGMKNWWDSITIEKYDVTDIGHGTGTGIINFYEDKIIING